MTVLESSNARSYVVSLFQVLNYSTFSHHPSLVSFPPRAPLLTSSASSVTPSQNPFAHSRQTYVIKQNTSVPLLRIPSAAALMSGASNIAAGSSSSLGAPPFIRGIAGQGRTAGQVTSSCLPPTLIRQPSTAPHPPPNIVKTPRYPLG